MNDQSPAPAPYKRSWKQFLIDPKYQLKYVFWITFSGFGLVVLNAATFYQFTQENISVLIDSGALTNAAQLSIHQELNSIIFKLVTCSLGFLVLVAGVGIVLSHKTAGPLFQFAKTFRAIRQGDLKARIHLRTEDDFHSVAQEFNQMMDQITHQK